ncbi:putative titin [Apostichopus japonicus]|uniref:Putative titin n=1 Tax=Stichopus japonicus TaxID=307972 RepID=A0A2G8JE01_STIJA|nr:putative titin [Apostichopus japonicus]
MEASPKSSPHLYFIFRSQSYDAAENEQRRGLPSLVRTHQRWWVKGQELHRGNEGTVRISLEPRHQNSDTEVTVDGLRIDTEYTFRVRAENKAGPGKPSNEVEAVAKPPFDIPDAPSKPEVSDVTENSATLNWSPPFSDGGSPIIGYTVEKKDKFGTRWTPVNKTPIEETTFVVSGLKEGEECQFRVIAENKAGHSEPSAATRAVRIKAQYDVPGQPGRPSVVSIDSNQATISWTAPHSDGGSPITTYLIEKKDRFSMRWTQVTKTPTDETEFTIPRLTAGDEYQFRVTAENKAGPGKPSEPTDTVVARPKFVEWEPPTSDGGAPIIGYIIERKDQYSVRWARLNRVPVAGVKFTSSDLKEGLEYQFRVIAENEAGQGKPSEPTRPMVAKEPYEKASAPLSPTLSEITAESATFTWQPPERDGGTAIDEYVIERKEPFSTRWAPLERVKDTSYTAKGLREGSDYEFRVVPVSRAGLGEPSRTTAVTPKPQYDVPGSPGRPQVSDITSSSVTLSWTPPIRDGGSRVTGYIIHKKDKFALRWVPVSEIPTPDTTFTVRALKEQGEYEFRVVAQNKAGFGQPSDTSDTVVAKPPYDVPGAPGKPNITSVTRSAITVSWTAPFSDGGSPITHYILEKRESFAVRWVRATNKSIHNTTFVIDGLKENTQFEFRVIAENKAGQGPPSDSTGQVVAKDAFMTLSLLSIAVPDAPGAPQISNMTSTSVNLTWTPPLTDGVAPKLDLSRVRDTIVVKAGTTFHIDIPFKATPLPSVDWSKDGTHLESTTRVKIETTEFGTVLTAKNCVKADEGVYSVRVRNAGGEATAKIRVVIEDKPYPPEGSH